MGRSDNGETKNKKRNANAMYLFSMIRLQGNKMMLIKLILDNEKVVLINGPYKRVYCDNRPQKVPEYGHNDGLPATSAINVCNMHFHQHIRLCGEVINLNCKVANNSSNE
uniref:Uncharacterized protein n=1 Tax=Parascaris univalens TaxID=6257 RepID=A0A915CF46_PARUN